jgi:hypothetical protein
MIIKLQISSKTKNNSKNKSITSRSNANNWWKISEINKYRSNKYNWLWKKQDKNKKNILKNL